MKIATVQFLSRGSQAAELHPVVPLGGLPIFPAVLLWFPESDDLSDVQLAGVQSEQDNTRSGVNRWLRIGMLLLLAMGSARNVVRLRWRAGDAHRQPVQRHDNRRGAGRRQPDGCRSAERNGVVPAASKDFLRICVCTTGRGQTASFVASSLKPWCPARYNRWLVSPCVRPRGFEE